MKRCTPKIGCTYNHHHRLSLSLVVVERETDRVILIKFSYLSLSPFLPLFLFLVYHMVSDSEGFQPHQDLCRGVNNERVN